ncbi:uncharacterized protein N7483_002012 [Penicillium malachiteum]|uniref:uncharacterized protein n=1 Tax=Penicillium malachiteum TaxID=1324776 RepID=UPI0025479E93|nr:uncharacterized protein N7483_002012 [Penicillium malachiteum]KAJ5736887.1 hypothetical protein N7483_002012 [Penicillium malachiteum]
MAKPSTRLSSVRLDSFLKALNASESTEVLLRLQFKEQEQSTLSDILTKTITKIGAESTDMTSRQQLQLALRVVQVCQDHVQFSTALLSDSSIRSLSDVAIKHYCSGGAGVIAAIKAPGIKSFRSALLAQVPTAVLYAVVSGNQLNLAPDLQTTLMKVLSLAIQENFDMSKGSLGNLVSQQAFQELIPNVKDRPMVRRTLERLQRLQNLVMDARDLKYLLNTPFASAQEIAAVKLEQFSEMLLQHNTPEDSINDIYSNALKISRSAEQLFTDIIRARQDVPILAVSGKIEPEKSKPTVTTTAEESIDLINLTTLFNDLDGVQTDSSTTVLSPAAYLVDLLQLLKRASLAPQSKSLPEAESPKNALDVLLSRRPDLSEIELSKENTEVPVRYMDLAIEVMEAFIKRQANDNLSHIAETEKQDIQLEEKKNADPHASDLTQKIVYQDQVGKKVYPMAVFPYNHAIACSREYLRARDLSRHLLLQTFRSDHALSGKSFGSSMTPCDVSMAKITNNRRIAAEYLGLQPGDFVAITQEAFQTMEFIERLKIHHVELLEKSYNRLIGAVSTAEYWGYHKEDAVSANFDMLDPSSSKRLSQVKLQLLPRAGISHSDLLRVLNTRFLGNRLVINVQQNGKYTDSLDGMRIQDSLTIDGDLKAAPKLSESTLLDLQAFIRLWHKLGWSIEDTDTAIIGLSRHKPRGKGRVLFPTLDGDFIERLAAAKKVADLTGCAIAELIPFWGPMDSLGPHSIYKRLFWSSGWVDLYPSLAFRRDDDSDTQQQPTIRDNMEPLLRALRMEQRDANLYMEIVGISYDSKWTLDHFSQLYRHHKMCSILGLTSSNYQNWYQLCLLDADPFLDPQSTLSVIERWFRLRDDSIPIKTVVDLLHPSFVAGERPKESSLTFIRDLLKGLSNIHKEFQIYTDPKLADDNQIFSQEAFLTTCEAMFNAEIAQTLVSIIEGMPINCRLSYTRL